MILYFTATGNSLAVAKIIAEATGNRLFDMGAAFREGRFEVPVEQGETLGFAFPTHAWSTPGLVDEFVRRVKFVTPDGSAFVPGYCFSVETYGSTPGTESRFFAQMLQKYQGIAVDSAFSVKRVQNCVYLFTPPAEEEALKRAAAADEEARRIALRVAAHELGAQAAVKPLGSLISKFTGKEGKPRSVKDFFVLTDKCIGCGTCARVCPTNTIRMVGGLPVWEGDGCTQCLACLHRCPQEASQYGKSTAKRRRYLNPVLR